MLVRVGQPPYRGGDFVDVVPNHYQLDHVEPVAHKLLCRFAQLLYEICTITMRDFHNYYMRFPQLLYKLLRRLPQLLYRGGDFVDVVANHDELDHVEAEVAELVDEELPVLVLHLHTRVRLCTLHTSEVMSPSHTNQSQVMSLHLQTRVRL